MFTIAPMPSWSDLLAGIAAPAIDGAELARPWVRDSQRAAWFSGGSAALRWIARHHSSGGTGPAVWLPDYFCNGATQAMRAAGARPVFYPIGADLNPDWTALAEMAARMGAPDLFVLVHYFGHAANGNKARAFCDECGAGLIEDAAHVLVPTGGIGAHGDYVIYSPHKVLPIPDGGLLLADPHLWPGGGAGGTADPGRRQPGTGIWALRRSLQKLMPAAALRHRIRGLPGFECDMILAAGTPAPDMSGLAQRLLARQLPRLDRIAARRKASARAWREVLCTPAGDCSALFDIEEEGPAPYRFVLRFGTETAAKARFGTLRAAGVAVETWPDLAPEVSAEPARFRQALALRRHLLFLPVHSEIDPRALFDRNH